jgi:uncharacterized membrane protein
MWTNRCALGAGILAALVLGCGEHQSTGPDVGTPDLAKGSGGGVSVSAAEPSYGKQGSVGLTVRVLGTGFDQGSRASWERDGAADPKIKVNSTAFVSASELVSNIDIALDAALDLYDIAVYTSGGRKGVGTERFEVTAATPISDPAEYSEPRSINDAGFIVGAVGDNAFFDGGARPFVWSPVTRTFQEFDVGAGAWAIDEAGTTIVGKTGDELLSNGKAQIWKLIGGLWQRSALPDLGVSSGARGLASHPLTGEVTMVVGMVTPPGELRKPAVWTRAASGDWTVQALTLPAGSGNGLAHDANALGMVVGFDGTGCCYALYYDANGQGTALPRLNNAASTAWAISEDGLKIVGGSNGRAVVWSRSLTSSSWPMPIQLEDTRAICGRNGTSLARDINVSGVIVGESCKQPVAWKPDGAGKYARIVLGGVGNGCTHGCSALAINDAGLATGRVSSIAVYWGGGGF